MENSTTQMYENIVVSDCPEAINREIDYNSV